MVEPRPCLTTQVPILACAACLARIGGLVSRRASRSRSVVLPWCLARSSGLPACIGRARLPGLGPSAGYVQHVFRQRFER